MEKKMTKKRIKEAVNPNIAEIKELEKIARDVNFYGFSEFSGKFDDAIGLLNEITTYEGILEGSGDYTDFTDEEIEEIIEDNNIELQEIFDDYGFFKENVVEAMDSDYDQEVLKAYRDAVMTVKNERDFWDREETIPSTKVGVKENKQHNKTVVKLVEKKTKNKKLKEDIDVKEVTILTEFSDLEAMCWSGASDTLEEVSENNLENKFFDYVDDVFNDGEEHTTTEVNDFIWFECDDWVEQNKEDEDIEELEEALNDITSDNFATTTAQGYEIQMYGVYKESLVIIALRKQTRGVDYLVGWAYDTSDGTWGQGHYDFKTFEEAKQYANRRYKGIEWVTLARARRLLGKNINESKNLSDERIEELFKTFYDEYVEQGYKGSLGDYKRAVRNVKLYFRENNPELFEKEHLERVYHLGDLLDFLYEWLDEEEAFKDVIKGYNIEDVSLTESKRPVRESKKRKQQPRFIGKFGVGPLYNGGKVVNHAGSEGQAVSEASTAFKKAVKNGGEDADNLLDGKALSRIKDKNERDMLIAQRKMEKEGRVMSDRVPVSQTLDRKRNQAERSYEKKAGKMLESKELFTIEQFNNDNIADIMYNGTEKSDDVEANKELLKPIIKKAQAFILKNKTKILKAGKDIDTVYVHIGPTPNDSDSRNHSIKFSLDGKLLRESTNRRNKRRA